MSSANGLLLRAERGSIGLRELDGDGTASQNSWRLLGWWSMNLKDGGTGAAREREQISN